MESCQGLRVRVIVELIIFCLTISLCGLQLQPTFADAAAAGAADPNDDCHEVQCPKAKKCPSDSYRLPTIIESSQEICCPPIQDCHCNPGLLCPSPIQCLDGSSAHLVTNLTGQPGKCCPIYECKENNNEDVEKVKYSVCSFDGEIYYSGESWTHQMDCTECNCYHGVVSCKPIQCDLHSKCALVRAAPGSCCPVCVGCIGNSGSVHNNSDIWEEDPCTTCECTEGRIKCHAAMCQTTCSNPIHISGECCPRCDNGPECPIMDCHRECPNGFRLSKSGCPTCKCNKCRSLADCVKECEFGFETNEKGCPICHCRRSEEGDIRHERILQVVHNRSDGGSDGIQVHQKEALKEVSKSVTDLELKCEETWDGTTHLNGEEWSDSCGKCVCKNGTQMCSLITCPLPQCEHPVFYPGSCCPRCPGEHIDLFQHETGLSVCQSSDGTEHVDGETWKLGDCLTCTCYDGQVLCAGPECPPTPCVHSMIQKEGDCCLTCPPNNIYGTINEQNNISQPTSNQSGSDTSLNCFSDDSQKVYKNGEMWKVGACQSCICEDGQVHCFSGGKCLSLECERPILAKNQCCPICLGKEKVKKRKSFESFCNENNHTYGEGEIWNSNSPGSPCSKRCFCKRGQVECDLEPCPPPSCSTPIQLEGNCCPICFETKSRKRVTTSNDLNSISNLDPQYGENPLTDKSLQNPDFSIESDPSSLIPTKSSETVLNTHEDDEKGVEVEDSSSGLEPHCVIIIIALIGVLFLLTLYTIRSCFFRRRIRLTKKIPFHSSNSNSSSGASSTPVTPDCCYKYTSCAQSSEQKTPLCQNPSRNINSILNSDKV